MSRVPEIDIAKGLGIALVVLGHSPLPETLRLPWLKEVIFAFHMPLFLFLAGLHLPVHKSFAEILPRRARNLLLPYAMGCLAFLADQYRSDPWLVLAQRLLWGNGQSLAWPWSPLWFLPHLFLTMCLAVVLAKTWKRIGLADWKWPCLFLLFLYGGQQILAWETASDWVFFDRDFSVVGLPWSLDLVPFSLVFLLAGRLWGQAALVHLRRPAVGIGCILAFGLVEWRWGWTLDLNLRTYEHLGGSTLAAFLGIAATLGLASGIAALSRRISDEFQSLGRSSLWILMVHVWILCEICGRWKIHRPWLLQTFATAAAILLPWGVFRLHERFKNRPMRQGTLTA
jgi:polysaccharide biosynthesis protein PslL